MTDGKILLLLPDLVVFYAIIIRNDYKKNTKKLNLTVDKTTRNGLHVNHLSKMFEILRGRILSLIQDTVEFYPLQTASLLNLAVGGDDGVLSQNTTEQMNASTWSR